MPATHETLDQTGHFASLEHPAEIAEIILEARNDK